MQNSPSYWPLILLGLISLLLILVVVLQAIGLSKGNAAQQQAVRDTQSLRTDVADQGSSNRREIGQSIGQMAQSLQGQIGLVREAVTQDNRVNREEVSGALRRFADSQERQLADLKASNEAKLEQMRSTVDEKLHATLEQRLGDSFKQVSDRLEQVHRGLGEMQSLATGVGDLKRVLSNVKTRGIWGEVQLANLLDQLLTADQYEANVATRPNSTERVEFAIRMPGRGAEMPVRLPIDAKFPREDYERLIEAQDRADAPAAEEAAKKLEMRIRLEAKTIRDKYIEPPYTTDFALLFLPTEGLFAEVLRRPGLTDDLQRLYRVTIAGPTTLSALLNSLQMGFRTLAIEQRSSEVRVLLGAVKTEFGKFGDVLAKTKAQLQSVTNTIDSAQVRSRAIERKLRGVEGLTDEQTKELLPSVEPEVDSDLSDQEGKTG
jgi:DNA recombination protein RmuC